MYEAGPAIGIGRECDGLEPMPVGGPKKFLSEGVYIARTGFWGVDVVKYTYRQARNIDIKDWAEVCYCFGLFDAIYYIYPI
jgi:hypothetical protein